MTADITKLRDSTDYKSTWRQRLHIYASPEITKLGGASDYKIIWGQRLQNYATGEKTNLNIIVSYLFTLW